MKIAILRTDGNDVDLRQYNSQELGLARGLLKQGHSVDIITARGTPQSPDCETVVDDRNGRIRLLRTGYRRIPVLEYGVLTGLRRLLKDGGYDLVHVSEENNPATTMVAFYCRSLGIPYVIYHGMYVVASGRARTWYDAFHGRVLAPAIRRNARAFLAKTSTAETFLRARGVADVKVLPVGLDTTRFETAQVPVPEHAMLEELRSRYQQVLLYVGRLEQRRNPMLLLDIAQAMAADTALVIVGDGPMREVLQQRVRDQGLDNVVMMGALGQEVLPDIYRQCDVFLLPSDYEIYGMVLLEALYFGLPCVTTATAGGVDVIGHHQAGEVIQGYDVSEWVAAIRKAGESRRDPGFRARIEALVRERFSWDAIAQRYLVYVKDKEQGGDWYTQKDQT